MTAPQIHVAVNDSVRGTAVAVLTDGTRTPLPAGTTCAWGVRGPICTMDNNGVGNPMAFTLTVGLSPAEVFANVKLPNTTTALPFVPEVPQGSSNGAPVLMGIPPGPALPPNAIKGYAIEWQTI